MTHQPVLMAPVISHLITDPQGAYVDATLGRGGHAGSILNNLGPQGRLLALDRDPEAIASAQPLLNAHPQRFSVQHVAFAHLREAVHGWLPAEAGKGPQVQGVLFDLGVSSPQLDQAERGFSFNKPGPLDMRMDPTQGEDAATWLAHAEEADIADVLYQYGEERRSRRIASEIVKQRAQQAFTRTDQLADLVVRCLGKKPGQKHPATRTFQAIRMHVNQELAQLTTALTQALKVLAPGGRLVVISFHSIEDRVVKHFMRDHARAPAPPRDPRTPVQPFTPTLRLVAKHLPTEAEVQANRRARSAVLRVAEKIGEVGA